MKTLKKLGAFAACLLLVLAAALPAFAADQHVYDMAGLFSQEETRQLEQQITDLRDKTGIDAAVVTANAKNGLNTQDFAEGCYVEGGFGVGREHSGFLYLIDMEDRVPHIATQGGAIDIFDDANLEKTLDRSYDYLASGDYAGSASLILNDFGAYYDDAVSRGFTYDKESGTWTAPPRKRSLSFLKILISALVAGIAGGGAVTAVKRQYALTEIEPTAALSLAASLAAAGLTFVLANQIDDLVDTQTVRRAIPVATAGKSGSGGSRPFGHSTTHTGAGGRTFGGRTGRKF